MIQLNTQSVEKQTQIGATDLIEIVSVFDTIQGEGPFVGTPCVFVRLAGCNLQCPGCDTDYTTDRRFVSVGQLYDECKKTTKRNLDLVVLTGGEPFRQPAVAEFVRQMLYSGYRIQVETNGSLFVEDFPWASSRLTVVCSPKTPVLNERLMPRIKVLKYVIRAGEVDDVDGLPSSVLLNGLRPARPWPEFYLNRGEVFVQPMDDGELTQNEANLQAAVESCMKFGYRLGTQVHKEIGLP